MFTELGTTLYDTLDGFGKILYLDGKIIPSYAVNQIKKLNKMAEEIQKRISL